MGFSVVRKNPPIMQTKIFLAALITSATANMDSIDKIYKQALTLKTNGTAAGMRSSAMLALQTKKLNEYGCWCYFDEMHGAGKGAPVDDYDKSCQKLHQAVSCAAMDIPHCDPTGQSYEVSVELVNGELVYDCVSKNAGDTCAEATCFMESHFTSALLSLNLVSELTPSYSEYHAALGFEHQSCARAHGPAREYNDVCCGTFKDNTRRPVRAYLDQGEKDCCMRDDGSFKTFNPTFNSCCDGKVLAPGTCP